MKPSKEGKRLLENKEIYNLGKESGFDDCLAEVKKMIEGCTRWKAVEKNILESSANGNNLDIHEVLNKLGEMEIKGENEK